MTAKCVTALSPPRFSCQQRSHDSLPVLFDRRRVRRICEFQFSLPRGERSAGRRGGVRDPRWMAGETIRWDACEASPRPGEGTRRLPALHMRRSIDVRAALSKRGPATLVSQLLAPGPNARERSPAITRVPRVTFPRSPRCRISQAAGFPGDADPVRLGQISAQSLTAAPSSRRPMTTPLEEQDDGLYTQVPRTGQ